MSELWLIPAFVLLVGAIVLFDALRRLMNETQLLTTRIAAVREPTPDARRLQAETQALRAAVHGLARRR